MATFEWDPGTIAFPATVTPARMEDPTITRAAASRRQRGRRDRCADTRSGHASSAGRRPGSHRRSRPRRSRSRPSPSGICWRPSMRFALQPARPGARGRRRRRCCSFGDGEPCDAMLASANVCAHHDRDAARTSSASFTARADAGQARGARIGAGPRAPHRCGRVGSGVDYRRQLVTLGAVAAGQAPGVRMRKFVAAAGRRRDVRRPRRAHSARANVSPLTSMRRARLSRLGAPPRPTSRLSAWAPGGARSAGGRAAAALCLTTAAWRSRCACARRMASRTCSAP